MTMLEDLGSREAAPIIQDAPCQNSNLQDASMGQLEQPQWGLGLR